MISVWFLFLWFFMFFSYPFIKVFLFIILPFNSIWWCNFFFSFFALYCCLSPFGNIVASLFFFFHFISFCMWNIESSIFYPQNWILYIFLKLDLNSNEGIIKIVACTNSPSKKYNKVSYVNEDLSIT